MVQGFYAKEVWGFPKGKINKGESFVDCAVREVLEETSFDASNMINEKDVIEITARKQTKRLYIIPHVSEEFTKFAPRTRKEIKV
jgi:mRNA-decapping enzyme subunit 2